MAIEILQERLITRFGSWPEVPEHITAMYGDLAEKEAELSRLRKAAARPRDQQNDLVNQINQTMLPVNQTRELVIRREDLRGELEIAKAEIQTNGEFYSLALAEFRAIAEQIIEAAELRRTVTKGGHKW